MNEAAIVLCGGFSRRMGCPKETLPFGPESLLERVVRQVGTVTRTIIVVAAPLDHQPNVEVPAGVLIARDPIEGRGPLQGIATGLAALPDTIDCAYVTAVDAPFLNPVWISYLANQIGGADIAVPFVGGRHHPLAALYRRRSVLPVAESLLRAGRMRPPFLLETLTSRIILEEEMRAVDPKLDTLRNLNTPSDYLTALRDAGYG